jgi:hypothetical protein
MPATRVDQLQQHCAMLLGLGPQLPEDGEHQRAVGFRHAASSALVSWALT